MRSHLLPSVLMLLIPLGAYSKTDPSLVIIPDQDNNGAQETATLLLADTQVATVTVSDIASGAQLSQMTYFDDSWTPNQALAISDDSLGVLAIRNDGLPGIQIKNSLTGVLVRNLFPWSSAWGVQESRLVPGLASGGASAVATLATRNSDGLMGVELRDPSDNTRIRIVYPLGLGWSPSAMHVADVNGQAAIAVLASRDSDALWIVQVRAASDGSLIRNVFPLGLGWTAREFQVIPDVNGNGADEVAVRMTRDSDGLEVIQIRDALTNTLIRNVYPIGAGGGGWQTQTFTTLDNSGIPVLGILSMRDSDGAVLVQRKNPSTGALINNVWFIGPPWEFADGLAEVSDINNNNVSELAVLVQNGDNGARLVQIRDTAAANVLRNLTVTAAPEVADPNISLVRVYPQLNFNQPVFMTQLPADGSTWYVVEKAGRIRKFDNNPSVQSFDTYLDINTQVNSAGEGGLLAMAFHPNFSNNRAVFLSYTTGNITSRISSFIADAQNDVLQVNTEAVVLTQSQPNDNHDGGGIGFGKDGNLYIGFGDGGGANDPDNHSQDPSDFLGSFLRINVDAINSYTVPSNNPFINQQGVLPETYAYGFRNPWRWSFDTLTGALWVGDVGQASFEEVDRVVAGGNYGWRCYEGNATFNTNNCPNASELEFPVYDYGRNDGQSVTGGYVYRGNDIPNLNGAFVYGDFVTGRIWALRPLANGSYRNIPLAETGLNISAFAQDNDGEIYFLSFNDGAIYKLEPAP